MQSELSSSRPDKLVTARKVGLASLSAKELEAGGFRGEFAAASLKRSKQGVERWPQPTMLGTLQTLMRGCTVRTFPFVSPVSTRGIT